MNNYTYFMDEKIEKIDQLFSIPIINIIYILKYSIENTKNIEIENFFRQIPPSKNFIMIENSYCSYFLGGSKYITKELEYSNNKLTFRDIIFNCITKSKGTNMNHRVLLNKKQLNLIRYISLVSMEY